VNRLCTKCNTVKSHEHFYRYKKKQSPENPMGLKGYCKPCCLAAAKEYYQTPEGYKYKIERSWKNKGINFTVEEYDRLLKHQSNCCAICGAEKCKNGDRLCVDHCHEKNEIRGLLCHYCNTAIGKFKDNPELIRKAAKYVEQQGVYHEIQESIE